MERTGLIGVEDTSQELKASRIKRDSQDLNRLLQTIDTTMNPFKGESSDHALSSIGSGKAVSPGVAQELSQIMEIGTQWYEEFKNRCLLQYSRFEAPIKRRKIKNFNTDALSLKSKGMKKIVELKET